MREGKVMRMKKVCLCFICMIMITGCSFLQDKYKEFKGELIGNDFDISTYDNYGNNIVNMSGDRISISGNEVTDYNGSTGSSLSSVITMTIDGYNFEQTGNTVVFAEKGLNKLKDFEMPTDIHTSSQTMTFFERNLNKIKNMLGTSKVVVICSQLGFPIAVYGGEQVYWTIPDDLPKMTRLNIDGKSLYIHRANYLMFDTALIE